MLKAVMSMPGKAWAAGFIGVFVLTVLFAVFPVGAQTPPDPLDYDANGDGIIDADELIQASTDYFNERTSLSMFHAVADAYEAKWGWPPPEEGASGADHCDSAYVQLLKRMYEAGLVSRDTVLRAIQCWLAGHPPTPTPTPVPPTPTNTPVTPVEETCEENSDQDKCDAELPPVDCEANPDHEDCDTDDEGTDTEQTGGGTNTGGGTDTGGGGRTTSSGPRFSVSMSPNPPYSERVAAHVSATVTITAANNQTNIDDYKFQIESNYASTGFLYNEHAVNCDQGLEQSKFISGSAFSTGHSFTLIRCGAGTPDTRGIEIIAQKRKDGTAATVVFVSRSVEQANHPYKARLSYSRFIPPSGASVPSTMSSAISDAIVEWNKVRHVFRIASAPPYDVEISGYVHNGGADLLCDAYACWRTTTIGKHRQAGRLLFRFPPNGQRSTWTTDKELAAKRGSLAVYVFDVALHELGHAGGLADDWPNGIMHGYIETAPRDGLTPHDKKAFHGVTAPHSH